MRKKFFLAAIFIAVILEASYLNSFRLFNVKPNLSLILLTLAGLLFNLRWALVFALSLGFLQAIFSSSLFWLNLLVFCLLGVLIVKLSRKICLDTAKRKLILIFCVVFAYNLIMELSLSILGRSIPLGIFFRITSLGSIYTLGLSYGAHKIHQFYSNL